VDKMMKSIKNMINAFGNVFFILWKSSKALLVGMLLVNILSGVLTSLNMIIWKNIIDAVQKAINSGVYDVVLYWLLAFGLLEWFLNVLSEVGQYFKNILASSANKYITQKVLDKTRKIGIVNYSDASIHDKIKKVNEESTMRVMNLLYSTESLIKAISVFVSTVIILIKFNPPIMIITLITSVPMLVISMKIAAKQFEIYNKRFESMRFIDYIKSMLTKHENIKEIKIYGVTDYFISFIDKLYEKYIIEDKKNRKRFSINIIKGKSIESIVIYTIKVIVCLKIIALNLTVGDFTLYINSIDNFKGAISNILSVITSIFENGLYVNNFLELINMEEDVDQSKDKIFDGNFQKIILQDVWFKYPGSDNYILKGINMEIECGKTYALVGLNGSGKTTILKLLLRLYKPDKGEIYIDDYNLSDIDTTSYYKYIAAVFQDFIKYPLTFRQNIGLGDSERMDIDVEIIEAANKSGIYTYIKTLPDNIDTKLKMDWSNATELSLGQWQKLAISRAFFKKSQIIVLDEPTASLDPVAELDISSKIKELTEGKTCVLIAHRFSTVKMVDRIYVLKGGKIEEYGSHSELLAKEGEYARLYNMQAQGYFE